jgi:glutamine synthetase
VASGYLATLDETLPDIQRVSAVRERLEQEGVKYIFACWLDLLGIPKTKPIPLSEFEGLCRGTGPQFAVHSVSMVPELGPADPDQIIVPDLDSLVVCPWDKSLAWVFADLFYEGSAYSMCPRQTLKRAIEAAREAGYVFYTGIEPEFMVMRYNEEGMPVKAFQDDPDRAGFRPTRQAYGYDAEFSLDAMPFLDEVIGMVDSLGWNVKNAVCEGAYSQFELDFGYTEPLEMADRFTFLKVLLKEVAKKRDLFVTFMPKPTQGDWRNGAHISHSFTTVDDPSRNLLASDGETEWSAVTFHALAGLIRHGAALTAITCPTVNSYKGLLGRSSDLEGGTVTWAPTHICYGSNNRSAMLRLPLTRKAIENRASDMAFNPYLGLAMTVAATCEGLTEGREPPDAVNTSLYDMSSSALTDAGVQPLPRNLFEAIAHFDADPLAREVLGPTMHKQYSLYKHTEWDRFHEHVTEWERIEYLRFF